MLNRIFTLFIVVACTGVQAQSTWESGMVKLENGKLVYTRDQESNRIPDFSYAGYKNSNVSIPKVTKVLKKIRPLAGDNTAHINEAIQSLSSVKKDKNGIRGVLVLEKGRYDVHGIIKVDVEGLVVRGEGSGSNPDSATVIYGRYNVPAKRTIMVVGSGDSKWPKGIDKTDIVTDFVPVNSHTFDVKDAKNFKSGDLIVIEHPCTEEWLKAIDYGGPSTEPGWKVNDWPIMFKRTITKISGNQITVDVPVYNHLNRKLSQSFIYKIQDNSKQQIGIENLRIEIMDFKERDKDEDHARNALAMTGVRDSWIRNVSTANFAFAGILLNNSERVTVDKCVAEDPVSLIHGGRRYNFLADSYSSQILFKDCVAKKGRHNFVSNGTTTVSGIVFLNCLSVDPYASSEGHRHWSMAMLFDNFKDMGILHMKNKIVLGIYSRGSYGTAHGWSNAHSVIWNCDLRRENGESGIVICQKPPTAQNYVIGGYGIVNKNVPFPEYPLGYVEGVNKEERLMPKSLFIQQLKDRIGSKLSMNDDFKVLN